MKIQHLKSLSKITIFCLCTLAATNAISQSSLDGAAPITADTAAGGDATGTLGDLTITKLNNVDHASCTLAGHGYRGNGTSQECTSVLGESSPFGGDVSGNQASGLTVRGIDSTGVEISAMVAGQTLRHNGSTMVNARLDSADVDHGAGTVATQMGKIPDQLACDNSATISPTVTTAIVRADVTANIVQTVLPDCTDVAQSVTVTNCRVSTAFARQVRMDTGDTMRLPSGASETVGVDLTHATADMLFRCDGAGEWRVRI